VHDAHSFAIDTDVQNGVAYLSGAVGSEIDKSLAEEIAKKDVHNELTVQ
jgi:osmotically-inducible protein OsmY